MLGLGLGLGLLLVVAVASPRTAVNHVRETAQLLRQAGPMPRVGLGALLLPTVPTTVTNAADASTDECVRRTSIRRDRLCGKRAPLKSIENTTFHT